MDVAGLRGNLRAACLEPFADLTPAKSQALISRPDRVKRQTTTDWHERPALGLMLMLWCFLKDPTDRDVLHLWEGTAMGLAMQKLLLRCEYGFENQEDRVVAQDHARALLRRPQAERLYRWIDKSVFPRGDPRRDDDIYLPDSLARNDRTWTGAVKGLQIWRDHDRSHI